MTGARAAWVAPTLRATPWRPLVLVAGVLTVVSAVSAYADRWSPGLLSTAAAAVAAAVVTGLSDPAAALLAALPTGPGVRRLQRLALLVPAGLATWLLLLLPARASGDLAGWPVGPLLALGTTGLAVAVWARGRPVLLGAAVPLMWVGLGWTAGPHDSNDTNDPVGQLLLAWEHHPWLVASAAATALIIRREP